MLWVLAKSWICWRTTSIPRSSDAFSSKTILCIWDPYSFRASARIVDVFPVPGGPYSSKCGNLLPLASLSTFAPKKTSITKFHSVQNTNNSQRLRNVTYWFQLYRDEQRRQRGTEDETFRPKELLWGQLWSLKRLCFYPCLVSCRFCHRRYPLTRLAPPFSAILQFSRSSLNPRILFQEQMNSGDIWTGGSSYWRQLVYFFFFFLFSPKAPMSFWWTCL